MNRWDGQMDMQGQSRYTSHILVCCYSVYVCSHNSNYYCPSSDTSFIPLLELAAVDSRNGNIMIIFKCKHLLYNIYITCNVQFLIWMSCLETLHWILIHRYLFFNIVYMYFQLLQHKNKYSAVYYVMLVCMKCTLK